jgi:uncharacterized membrane protein
MAYLTLVLGLLVFLGAHSIRIFADDWRTAQIAKFGAGKWKGSYTLVSIVGFVLIVQGFAAARVEPVLLWSSPVWARHLASLGMLIALILLVAAYVPRNHIKAKLQHPMVLAVKVWALVHLLANGRLVDVLLFGSFLVWAVLDFRSARQRGPVVVTATVIGTLITLVVGAGVWFGLVCCAHQWLFGVRPFG